MGIIQVLEKASKAYYEGTPILSDEEFDTLVEITGYKKVGFSSTKHNYQHTYPMRSLKKCVAGDKPPELKTPIVVTPKLDGSAVSLVYINKKLVLALRRGDGVKGDDITDKMKLLVAGTEPNISGLTQITGEVVAPKTTSNARNYASGALNLKNIEEFKTRDLTFIAYSMQPNLHDCWTEDMEWLFNEGFNTVIDSDWNEFPQDGKVFRTDNYIAFERAGSTAQFPKGAYALKEKKEGVVTKLLDVIWQLGKSGVVSPVAILKPIKIEDATVSRATLHNIEYITTLNLEIGCDVEVIRSGEIIPRIVRRI